jgi:hypothetical protein
VVSRTPWDSVDYSHNREFLANLDRDHRTPLRDDCGDGETIGVLDEEPDPPHDLDTDPDAVEPETPLAAPAEETAPTRQNALAFATDGGPVDSATHTDDPARANAAVSRRFSVPVAAGFLGVVAVVTIGLAAAMIGMQSTPKVAPPPLDSPTRIAVAPAAPPTETGGAGGPPAAGDAPIPYQASSPCPQAGSSSAQNIASGDPTRAWVCVRDGDGQVLTLDLGKPMKITAITLTPGWIGTDASGTDQWMAHRVLTRVQWILINGEDRTVLTQNTNNIHGPATQAMPSNGPDQGVLASQIQMIVLQTSRPPADNPGTSGAPTDTDGGGFIDGVLGAPLGPPPAATTTDDPAPGFGATDTDANADPVDNTFAVSAVTILGHPPL